MAGRGQSKMKFIHKRARWQCNMGTECMWPDVGLALWVLIHILFKPDAFYCEVSTDTPIFTKASADELMSVFCA